MLAPGIPDRAVVRVLLAGLWLLACGHAVPSTPPERSYPTGNPARFARVEPGQSPALVQQLLGELPIANPLAADQPFANPHLELVIEAPEARRVRIWLFLTELRTHAECPFLTFSDRPVAFEDERVVASSWSELEARLESWGQSADWYRALRYPRFGSCRRGSGGSR